MPIYLKDKRYFATRKTKAITIICTSLVLIYGAIQYRVGKVEVENDLSDMKTFVQANFPGGLLPLDKSYFPDSVNQVHFFNTGIIDCDTYDR